MNMKIAVLSMNLQQAKFNQQKQIQVSKMAIDNLDNRLDFMSQTAEASAAEKPANMIKTRPSNMFYKVL